MTNPYPVGEPDLDQPWSPQPARARLAAKVGKPRRKPESEVVTEGMAWLNGLPRTKAWKIHGGTFTGSVGEPDVDGCSNGRSLKFEAKAGTAKPTDMQLVRLREWARCGALVGWFRTTRHLEELMDHLDTPGFVPDLAHPGCACPIHTGGA